MLKWYVVQVMSGHENKIKRTIDENREVSGMTELIQEVLVPSEKVSEVKRGQQKIMDKRIWPGYILLKMTMTDESWDYIKKSNGVIDFLGGGKPTALTQAEVDNILKELEEKQKGVVHKHSVEIGDNVKIIDGVFINFIGTVQEVNHEKGRLGVLVSIFGRDTRVDDLEFWQVEEVTSESQN